MNETSERFLTRKDIVALKNKTGVPVSPERVNRAAARGDLKPDAFYGRVHLYKEPTAMAWIKTLIQPAGTA
jgi:hypothetical protein